jgi:hypothetical protein
MVEGRIMETENDGEGNGGLGVTNSGEAKVGCQTA